MVYLRHWQSPVGEMIMASNGQELIGLWFADQKKYPVFKDEDAVILDELDVFHQTIKWLDIYFSGKEPGFVPPLTLMGTDFRQLTARLLQAIPYGTTITYGELGKIIAPILDRKSMSAQAVGGAVGHNTIAVIVPCHRVVGADGKLTGYAGGVWRKEYLLRLEQGESLESLESIKEKESC